METTERIEHEAGNKEAWICLCRNTPTDDGFYPCDENGDEVEPTEAAWKTNLYVCAHCGRMIDFTTLEVVGRNKVSDVSCLGSERGSAEGWYN